MHVHGYNGPYQPIQTVAYRILETFVTSVEGEGFNT